MVSDWNGLDQGSPYRRDNGTASGGGCLVCGERYSIMYWMCAPASSGPYCAEHFPMENKHG